MTRDDAGFTLPEILVAIVITAVIVPALFAAFVTGVRTTEGTTDRLSASNDAAFTSSWFVPDVQSADAFSATDVGSCPSPSAPGRLFTLTRLEGTTTIVTGYAVVGGSGGTPRTLVRYACTGTTPDPTVTVAHSLDATIGPSVVCTPNPCGASTDRVSLTVTDTTGYSFVLNAERRRS